jgi:hypothetical protein
LSFGTASFVIDDSVPFLTMTVTIFNIDITGSQTPNDLNDNLVNAHIHVGAPPGVNAACVGVSSVRRTMTSIRTTSS